MKKISPEYRAYLEAQVAKGGEVGASAASILIKYSPDQPRDDHGRFASGGGGGGGSNTGGTSATGGGQGGGRNNVGTDAQQKNADRMVARDLRYSDENALAEKIKNRDYGSLTEDEKSTLTSAINDVMNQAGDEGGTKTALGHYASVGLRAGVDFSGGKDFANAADVYAHAGQLVSGLGGSGGGGRGSWGF